MGRLVRVRFSGINREIEAWVGPRPSKVSEQRLIRPVYHMTSAGSRYKLRSIWPAIAKSGSPHVG